MAKLFLNKDLFPELIDVNLDGDSMLHSVYFSTIENGGKDYSSDELTTSSKYRENLTEANYLIAAGDKDKLILAIKEWITQYGQKLIDNKDKFSSVSSVSSTTLSCSSSSNRHLIQRGHCLTGCSRRINPQSFEGSLSLTLSNSYLESTYFLIDFSNLRLTLEPQVFALPLHHSVE